MGEALLRDAAARRRRRVATALVLSTLGAVPSALVGQYSGDRQDGGRFSFIAEPKDSVLAHALLASALAHDTFPGLPRPRQRVLIVIAGNARRFREYAGAQPPEWGSAFAFPAERRIVMQGSSASSQAGDPLVAFRHELAHLALHEFLGDLPPRWFDEGYASFAAGEWGRDEVLATNVALAIRGAPTLAALDSGFYGGSSRATSSYALAHRAIAELSSMDPQHGLALLFSYWPQAGSLDSAIRQAYGITLSDFEKRWRARTKRRYGALAIFADLTVSVLLLLFVITPLYLARRQRDRQRLALMRAFDAEQDRIARESAIEALLQGLAPPAPPDDVTREGS